MQDQKKMGGPTGLLTNAPQVKIKPFEMNLPDVHAASKLAGMKDVLDQIAKEEAALAEEEARLAEEKARLEEEEARLAEEERKEKEAEQKKEEARIQAKKRELAERRRRAICCCGLTSCRIGPFSRFVEE